jgi:nitroreductase
MQNKNAKTNYPVHPLIEKRWSPRAFSAKMITRDTVMSLLEAARWAASSYNEQPWRFIVATKNEPEEFEKALQCLGEFNQVWAKSAPVLVLTFAKQTFSRNGKPNHHASHDVGLAIGNLSLQATNEGIYLHQMAGILRDKIREVYSVPDDFFPATAIAIGYPGDPAQLEDDLRASEIAERDRKPLGEIAFAGEWGRPVS